MESLVKTSTTYVVLALFYALIVNSILLFCKWPLTLRTGLLALCGGVVLSIINVYIYIRLIRFWVSAGLVKFDEDNNAYILKNNERHKINLTRTEIFGKDK
jgi:hypothetical protein